MFEKYDMLIPQGVIFNLKEIEDMKIIKSDMAKKLIYNNELEVVKIGKKIHISRTELIRFLVANTIKAKTNALGDSLGNNKGKSSTKSGIAQLPNEAMVYNEGSLFPKNYSTQKNKPSMSQIQIMQQLRKNQAILKCFCSLNYSS